LKLNFYIYYPFITDCEYFCILGGLNCFFITRAHIKILKANNLHKFTFFVLSNYTGYNYFVLSNSPHHLVCISNFSLVVVVRAIFLPVKYDASHNAQEECGPQDNVDHNGRVG
jgi:hypothetical protein